MKKTYNEPELELVFISNIDVLTYSLPETAIDTDINKINIDTDID